MKNIHLHVDDELFYRMKHDKLLRERKSKIMMTWEEYVKMLFGFNRNEKEVRASK